MKTNKATVLTFAEKCKSILSANWRGQLNTIKADAKGSKEDIYTSKIKYICKRGKPYIWIPEKELHNVNLIVDERGSFSVASPIPGPLAGLLRSIKKLPDRVALTGDVVPLTDEKAQSATKVLREVMQSEQRAISASSYTVSGVLSSSDHSRTSRSENLKDLLEGDEKYIVYKFNQRSCMYIDGNGSTHEIDEEDMGQCKADPLACLSAKLIDGINQSVARRRALTLFCLTYKNANAKDAYMLSVDHKGFEVLSKVAGPLSKGDIGQYQWKEFRFNLKEEARDVESFCRQLVEMEMDAVKEVSSHSGLA
ncbi:PREDICTED: uncharacterized protein LOC101292842 [Fragaria vesca subsp. vesca]|uniref:uncharacterized protein LOC101292842 n=1 Tax=Fragaria vesca subsp. vesca TaxID=101020 RepID=UPI0002C2F047|nr:PREDICTED: uncharacterized protein LOC101292842 [Fragaria vesca subsp. vesca]